jgi:transcriptional regulator with XRE-family HTH domain
MPFNKKIPGVVLSNVNQMDLHNKIKFFRLSKNLTQAYLADELQIDVANYSRLERGETSITIDRLQKIADLLGVHVHDLLAENTTPTEGANVVQPILEKYLREILNELKSINNKFNN